MSDTEATIQSALDADPGRHDLRLLLSDHLEDLGDPRALGYRPLGELERVPELHDYWGYAFWIYSTAKWKESAIPGVWWLEYESHQRPRHTRRQADDAAALAFARLTPDQQAAILRRETVPV